MHLANLGINAVPRPNRFVQSNADYFKSYGVNYTLPANCRINTTSLYQECSQGETNFSPNITGYSLADWLFTTQPGAFGLFPGFAFPTGVILISVVTIMFVCSLPFVRRRGNFEIFYFSHLLYVLFYGALIFHAPACYKWTLVPMVLFSVELLYRFLSLFSGNVGASYVKAGLVLPSKVTGLVIAKPDRFKFHPGDWVFIKIPSVAKFEWHPFTISSGPEENDNFTLHIRAVGGWTTKLHDMIADLHSKQGYFFQTVGF